MLVSSAKGEGDGLWVANVLLFSLMSVRGNNESREYALLQSLDAMRPIDTVNETLGCVCLR